MKILKWLDAHFEEAFLCFLLVVILVVSFLQVIIRKIPWIPSLTWAEEFCRFCWIWSVFLSLPYTIKKGSMLRVTMILDIIPPKMAKILNIIVDIITLFSMALLFFYSITVVCSIKTSAETSPAMLIPMWIIYSMMLIGFFLAVIRGIQQIIYHIKHFKDGTISMIQQVMAEAEEEAAMAKGGAN